MTGVSKSQIPLGVVRGLAGRLQWRIRVASGREAVHKLGLKWGPREQMEGPLKLRQIWKNGKLQKLKP